MFGWIWRGIRTGVLTTRYPAGAPQGADSLPPTFRGRPVIDQARCRDGAGDAAVAICPTQALQATMAGLRLDLGRCIQCGLCAAVCPAAIRMTPEFELAVRQQTDLVLDVDEAPDEERVLPVVQQALKQRVADLRRSVHIRHVDAGSDGAVEQEVYALTNPYYDIHRLGLFFTPAPRHADVLLVTGAVTRAMAEPLRETYAAMPRPKLVIAAGTAACSGGVYRGSYATLDGVAAVLPVDVFIPGAPPPPLALIYGLLLGLGRLAQRVPMSVVAVGDADTELPPLPILNGMAYPSAGREEGER
jgi:Ni,Fe-hydrogenase III small subunit/Pyruvate/2-oxoacid:ferredoxin oxidoreductase delta subunit